MGPPCGGAMLHGARNQRVGRPLVLVRGLQQDPEDRGDRPRETSWTNPISSPSL
jgi:hypothetical protein